MMTLFVCLSVCLPAWLFLSVSSHT